MIVFAGLSKALYRNIIGILYNISCALSIPDETKFASQLFLDILSLL